MKKILYLITGTLFSIGVQAQTPTYPFMQPSTPGFNNSTLRVYPKYFDGNYSSDSDFLDVLAISGDCTVYDPVKNTFAPMKGNISNIFTIRTGENEIAKDSSLTIFASVDKNQQDAVLGDGGGVFYFKVRRDPATGVWRTESLELVGEREVYFKNVNFNAVGGTVNNKDFFYLGDNAGTTSRFLVTEDATDLTSNDALGFGDKKDYAYPVNPPSRSVIPAGKVLPKYLSLGWPVEIDGTSGEVISRVHRLGRGATNIVKIGSDYIFTYPGNPTVIARYSPKAEDNVSNRVFDRPEQDTTTGRGSHVHTFLKINPDGVGWEWVPFAYKSDSVPDVDNPRVNVPRFWQDFDSLVVAKEVALRAGATMFANVGDLAISYDSQGNEVLLISEKGIDDSGDLYNNPAKKYNGQLAPHLVMKDEADGTADSRFSDPYGRILVLPVFNSFGASLSVLTEGGASQGDVFFSNPDKMDVGYANNSTTDEALQYLIVKENIPATDKGRNPEGTPFEKRVNEAFYLQLVAEVPLSNSFLSSDISFNVLPVSFDRYRLFQSGSNGSLLSSSSDALNSNNGNSMIPNMKARPSVKLDSYFSLINGEENSDKSLIYVIRGINEDINILGLEQEEALAAKRAFAVWPNPATSTINVKDAANYTLTDVSGTEVKNFTGTSTLDVSDIQPGMYFLKKERGAVAKVIIK